jgi:hypothetical protein
MLVHEGSNQVIATYDYRRVGWSFRDQPAALELSAGFHRFRLYNTAGQADVRSAKAFSL